MPGALQGTERTPGDHTGGERAKRDVRPQRGRSRHGHLPFRLRPCRVGRPQATQPDERRQDQGTEDHAREPFPEDRAGAVRVAAARCQGTRFALKYEGLKRRMPAQKALVAIARKLLVVIWNVLAKREKYRRNLYETASEDERKGKRH